VSVGPRRTRTGERGQVAGIEALPFGLLIFVSGTLLIVNIWGVVDAKFAADAAAREAARFVVESAVAGIDPAVVRAGAVAVATQTFEDHGRDGPVTVTVTAGLERCDRVRVELRTSVPAIRLPFVGGFGEAFDVVAAHAELIDPTRSGVAGPADCIR
jgi:hypothetical protein